MDLQKKFEAGEKKHTYQRIDADYKVNIFLGYNDDGCMSMVITENGVDSRAKSTKIIDVKLKRREDKKLALSFDLLDDAYKSMFLVFCKDIIVICEKSGPEMAISSALMRWKYWKEMFGRRKSQLLDKSEIKGLIGELLELKNFFMEKFDETKAVSSWMGPMLGHKDFEIDDTWYEIKAVSENATQVIISSLEQLESDIDGHLVIVRLEETSTTAKNAINLNSLISSIVNMIEDPENLEMFRVKLDNVGYSIDVEYDTYNFLYKSTQRYVVNSEFPRLRRENLNACIGNVKYSILLNGISEFTEE